jgi:hypothetical protein
VAWNRSRHAGPRSLRFGDAVFAARRRGWWGCFALPSPRFALPSPRFARPSPRFARPSQREGEVKRGERLVRTFQREGEGEFGRRFAWLAWRGAGGLRDDAGGLRLQWKEPLVLPRKQRFAVQGLVPKRWLLRSGSVERRGFRWKRCSASSCCLPGWVSPLILANIC